MFKPSAAPQTLLTVSGICRLNFMDCWLSVFFTYKDVTAAKGVDGVVNIIGSNEDRAHSQSDSAPNPQSLKPLYAVYCKKMISFASLLQRTSPYFVKYSTRTPHSDCAPPTFLLYIATLV